MGPKLRDVEAHMVRHQGQPMILLRDPLGLSDSAVVVPQALAPLLGLMDGTRDEQALEAALVVRTGVRLPPGVLSRLLNDLDKALLLENERFAEAGKAALQAYLEAPFRPMTLAGSSYPAGQEEATARLQALVAALPPAGEVAAALPVRGLISPHIDYQRGGPVYAAVWRAAAKAAQAAELAIVFGTDHKGSDGALTLTRQSYATPWGLLPTDQSLVERLAAALGSQAAFAEELHHAREHSIELAAVWLHFVRGGSPVPLLPVLCGGFGCFVAGDCDPSTHESFEAALQNLSEVVASRRVLVVAAADLAHMGPAFGDAYPLDGIGKVRLRAADEMLLSTVCAGDADAFFTMLKNERDRRHVCGLPPIYLTLRLLAGTTGRVIGYDVCPADPQGKSWVSIAGITLD